MPDRLPKQTPILLVMETLQPSSETRYMINLSRGLIEEGVLPYIAAPDRGGLDQLSKDEVERTQVFPGILGGFRRPFVYPRMLQWAKLLKPKLIHGLSAFTAPVCQRLARDLEVPFVLSVNHYQNRGSFRISGHCSKTLAASDSIMENLVNKVRVAKEGLEGVPLGIPLPALPESRNVLTDQYPMVVTFSRLTAREDVATFLRAAKKVLNVQCGGCQFLIVGEGPEEPALRKLTRELDLVKHVTFSHIQVPYDRILKDASVFVQTPRQQGFGAAVLEAMAWGLPVVATSTGSLISLVREGVTGFLVSVGDSDVVAERILELLQDDELRATLGANARATVAERFSFSRMIERTIAVYAEVIGRNKVGRESDKAQKLA